MKKSLVSAHASSETWNSSFGEYPNNQSLININGKFEKKKNCIQIAKIMTTLFLLISDSDSSTTISHNLDDFISMDPEVGIGDVLHLMDFVGRFFRHLWIVKSIINYQLYIQRCHFAYDIQQILTMKKRFDEKKMYSDG